MDLHGHGVMGTFDHLDTEQGVPGHRRVQTLRLLAVGQGRRQA